jgi:hypothetical protein
MPRASIFIDPTIILLGLCRPRHHPYGRDDNTSCETLWKSRRKKFHEQFSVRRVRRRHRWDNPVPGSCPTLSNHQCNVARQPLGEARPAHAKHRDNSAIPVPGP